MSLLGRPVSVRIVVAMAGVMLLSVLLPALSGPRPREVTLVVKGMAFYLEGDPDTPNPTIEVKAGERVRLVVRNEDRGMTHDFAVPAISAAMNAIEWNESGDVLLKVPDRRGTYEYVCRPHRLMMRGTILVD